jgi:hypothetical protein
MKKSFIVKLFLFFIAINIFLSCKKDPPVGGSGNGDPVTHFSKTTLDYCFFKPGSWWVYVDSISGTKDSVYVTSSSLNNDTVTEEDNVGYTGIFERFYVYMDCSYLGFTQKQYAHSAASQYSNFDHVQYYRYKPGFTSGTESLFLSTFQDGFSYGLSPGIMTVIGKYDSILINNKYYKDVVLFYNDGNSAEYSNETYTYFAKDIGLVKKNIPDSSRNWVLINYNVVK